MTTIKATIQKDWPDKLILGISGGLDSTVLLDAMQRYAPATELILAHVNYHLRPEADGDAAFVAQLAQQYQLPSYQRDCYLEPGHAVEAQARAFRYAFFEELCWQEGAGGVLLAQHQDDQVETVLLQLIRGGRFQTKGGMAEKKGQYYRPFLSLPKAALLAYAQAQGLTWREDQTNQDPDYTGRNRLRQEVLPALTKIDQDAKEHLAAFASNYRQDQELLAERAAALLPRFQADYHTVPVAWWPHVLAALCRRAGYYALSDRQLQAALALLQNNRKPNGRLALGQSLQLVRAYEKIWIDAGEKKQKSLQKQETLVLKLNQWQFSQEVWFRWGQGAVQGASAHLALPGGPAQQLTLRPAQKTDRLPLKNGSKSIRRLLIDHKIPVLQRPKTWLLVDQDNVVRAAWLGQQDWVFNQLLSWDQGPAQQWLEWRIEGSSG
ncbi:tRNA lysidine(34) synthetase TilS [Leuconostocaceae bacterium ESL0958]|nr:tRNA lysidine(34) synthetase TilS [Leuconostocaceae bacterium ESL0958]